MNKCKTSAESNVLSRLHAMKREQNTPNCCTDSCQMFFINNRQTYKAFTQNMCSSQSTIIMFIKQWSDVWALSRLKSTFLWKDQYELICHERLPKANRFISFMSKSLKKLFLWWNMDFCGSYFLRTIWNWGFGTNMESNVAVTLHFEDLAVNNYLFFKYVCMCLWKISNCSFEYFWSMWNLFFYFY